jgi:hypothetical protein
MNYYFEVVEPLFYFDKIGISLSNTYIGASRAFDNIYVGRNAEPGDVFHLLVGGDFLSKDDGQEQRVAFRHPKPLLEKSYGGGVTSHALFAALEKRGIVREIAKPDHVLDFKALNESRKYPESHPRLRYDETSASFKSIVDAAQSLKGLADYAGLTTSFYDYHLERRAVVQLSVEATRARVFEAQLDEEGELFIRPSPGFFDCEAFVEAVRNSPFAKTGHIHNDCLWATDAAILDSDELIMHVRDLFEAKFNPESAAAPAPR